MQPLRLLATRDEPEPPVSKPEKLEEHEPEAPNVHLRTVPAPDVVARNDLGRDVRGGAAFGPAPPGVVEPLSYDGGETEVGEDRAPVVVNEDVLRFDILVHDTKLPQSLESGDLIEKQWSEREREGKNCEMRTSSAQNR